MHNTPFSRSYWVIPGKFLAGCYPGDRNVGLMEEKTSALLRCGIRWVINLMEENEHDHDGLPFVDYAPALKRLAAGGPPVVIRRLPIRDLGIPSRDFMVEILDLIDGELKEDQPVYVHCWGGRGRTGTVVGCWLIRHGIAKGEAVLEKIGELRRFDPTVRWPSPEMPEQIRLVLSWKKGQ